jgi:hypothetical protein
MRLFRRARDTKSSAVIRPAGNVADEVELKSVVPPASSGAAIAPTVDSEPSLPAINVPPAPPSYEVLDDSDVFVCTNKSASVTSREVTLFVHRWHNVEPGLLSWTFPSLRSALDAVQRMKNAIGWCVVSGTNWHDLDSARSSGAVLVEQLS